MVTVTSETRATIRTSLGNMVLEFISDKAPRTCENFVTLAQKGFYDGTKFHRIIKDFVVQGGCPHGNGKGGPGYTIRPEFNDTPHVPGTVSMARDNDPNSGGSQFFICTSESPYLDSRYTAFARVVDGMDVLEKLGAVPTDIQPKYKEKSVPRDPVYLNGIELEGVIADPVEEAPPAAESSEAASESAGGNAADSGGESSGSKRGRRGRGRRGKGGGERTAEAEAPSHESGSEASAEMDAKPPAKKASRKRTSRSDSSKSGSGDKATTEKAKAQSEEKPKKKATRKKATRKKPASDEE
jgi:peptidyl-prolyl cis-trans isomerase B (cyclophilin B)